MEFITKDETEALPTAGHQSALELLVDAFHDNPAHVYIAPEPTTRRAKLTWIFERNLRIQTAIGESFCRQGADDDARVDAMAFWHAPETRGAGLANMIRVGLLCAPFKLGWAETRRMLEATGGVDEQIGHDLDGESVWLLNNMIVRRECRGTGLGSAVLGAQLRDRVAPSGYRACLATQRPENVTFYQRLGFEVTSKEIIGRGSDAFPNWVMVWTR